MIGDAGRNGTRRRRLLVADPYCFAQRGDGGIGPGLIGGMHQADDVTFMQPCSHRHEAGKTHRQVDGVAGLAAATAQPDGDILITGFVSEDLLRLGGEQDGVLSTSCASGILG